MQITCTTSFDHHKSLRAPWNPVPIIAGRCRVHENCGCKEDGRLHIKFIGAPTSKKSVCRTVWFGFWKSVFVVPTCLLTPNQIFSQDATSKNNSDVSTNFLQRKVFHKPVDELERSGKCDKSSRSMEHPKDNDRKSGRRSESHGTNSKLELLIYWNCFNREPTSTLTWCSLPTPPQFVTNEPICQIFSIQNVKESATFMTSGLRKMGTIQLALWKSHLKVGKNRWFNVDL